MRFAARQMDGGDFAGMIVDNFDEMLRQSKERPLQHLNKAPKRVWFPIPGTICSFMGGKKNADPKA